MFFAGPTSRCFRMSTTPTVFFKAFLFRQPQTVLITTQVLLPATALIRLQVFTYHHGFFQNKSTTTRINTNEDNELWAAFPLSQFNLYLKLHHNLHHRQKIPPKKGQKEKYRRRTTWGDGDLHKSKEAERQWRNQGQKTLYTTQDPPPIESHKSSSETTPQQPPAQFSRPAPQSPPSEISPQKHPKQTHLQTPNNPLATLNAKGLTVRACLVNSRTSVWMSLQCKSLTSLVLRTVGCWRMTMSSFQHMTAAAALGSLC